MRQPYRGEPDHGTPLSGISGGAATGEPRARIWHRRAAGAALPQAVIRSPGTCCPDKKERLSALFYQGLLPVGIKVSARDGQGSEVAEAHRFSGWWQAPPGARRACHHCQTGSSNMVRVITVKARVMGRSHRKLRLPSLIPGPAQVVPQHAPG